MKARKIDLRNYKVTVNRVSSLLQKILTTPGVESCLRNSGQWDGAELDSFLRGGPTTQEYDVKESILNVLFALGLPARKAWEKRDPLCKKIKMHNGYIHLETPEYAMLLKAFEQWQSPGRNDEELLKRIFGAKEVEMKEDKK